MVGLLEFTVADLDDVRQVPADLREQLASDRAFAEEQAVERIRMLRALFLQRVEVLSMASQ